MRVVTLKEIPGLSPSLPSIPVGAVIDVDPITASAWIVDGYAEPIEVRDARRAADALADVTREAVAEEHRRAVNEQLHEALRGALRREIARDRRR
jgi:hypothetical protein